MSAVATAPLSLAALGLLTYMHERKDSGSSWSEEDAIEYFGNHPRTIRKIRDAYDELVNKNQIKHQITTREEMI
jgi:hypothetical protein